METPGRETLHVDCGRCRMRGPTCSDCVITVLLGAPTESVDLDGDEQAALSALAQSGMVPPLRLVPGARPGLAVQGRLGGQEYA
ncbi:MAG: hypothetical protein ACLGIF_11070 [Actinomycetes bacterium]